VTVTGPKNAKSRAPLSGCPASKRSQKIWLCQPDTSFGSQPSIFAGCCFGRCLEVAPKNARPRTTAATASGIRFVRSMVCLDNIGLNSRPASCGHRF